MRAPLCMLVLTPSELCALASLESEPAQAVAVESPWCAVTKDGDHWDCSYRSVAECQSNVVAGNRGPYFIAVSRKRRPVRQVQPVGPLWVISGHLQRTNACPLYT
jgi:hypothetical protein